MFKEFEASIMISDVGRPSVPPQVIPTLIDECTVRVPLLPFSSSEVIAHKIGSGVKVVGHGVV